MKLYVKVDKLEHGKEIPGKLGRWCKNHQVIHGRFYACEYYPLEIKQEIRQQERRWLHASANYALMFLLFVLMFFIGAMRH